MVYEYSLLIGPSKIHVKTDRNEAIPEAIKKIKHHIMELSEYLRKNPLLKYSLEPIDVGAKAPLIVRRMAEAARVADVGPMASVAGVIADLCLESLLKMGANIAVVEDGGEVSAFTAKENIPISILTGERNLSGRIGFLITSEESPLGVGTSTGKADRTISFGEADSVTVVAENAAIADAAATAICNVTAGVNIKKSIYKALERAKSIKGVRGVIIVHNGHVGLTGKLPKIIKIKE